MTGTIAPMHRPATLAEALAILKAIHKLSPAEQRDIDEAISCIVAFDGITDEMVEKALAAARDFLAPSYVIDVREAWTHNDREATRAMLEAVIESMKPVRSRAVQSEITPRAGVRISNSYQDVFNAIAKAVKIEGTGIAISVEAFLKAIPTATEGSTPDKRQKLAAELVIAVKEARAGYIKPDQIWLTCDMAEEVIAALGAVSSASGTRDAVLDEIETLIGAAEGRHFAAIDTAASEEDRRRHGTKVAFAMELRAAIRALKRTPYVEAKS